MAKNNLPRTSSSPTLASLPWERVVNGVEIRDRLIEAGVDLVGEVEALTDEDAGVKGFSADDLRVIDAVLLLGKRIGLGTWTVIDISEEMSINDLPWSVLGREALAVCNRLRQCNVSSINDLERRPHGFLTHVAELNTFQQILVERILALAGR